MDYSMSLIVNNTMEIIKTDIYDIFVFLNQRKRY